MVNDVIKIIKKFASIFLKLRTCRKYFENKNIKIRTKYKNYFYNLFIITHQLKLMFI